jgi:hypothetical protein
VKNRAPGVIVALHFVFRHDCTIPAAGRRSWPMLGPVARGELADMVSPARPDSNRERFDVHRTSATPSGLRGLRRVPCFRGLPSTSQPQSPRPRHGAVRPLSGVSIFAHCRGDEGCGGVADMARWPAHGSHRWPTGAHRKSAKPADNWRTGGLPPPKTAGPWAQSSRPAGFTRLAFRSRLVKHLHANPGHLRGL